MNNLIESKIKILINLTIDINHKSRIPSISTNLVETKKLLFAFEYQKWFHMVPKYSAMIGAIIQTPLINEYKMQYHLVLPYLTSLKVQIKKKRVFK
jgi:hypothetical protein